MNTDTIAAIATGMTPSGIGIIRVSGEDAFSIASSVFRKKNNKPLAKYEDHRAYFGYIYDNDRVLDEVILLVFKGPNSYSGEDTVEIQCHGGILVMNRILELCINSGARCAKPGEFTKRAFLNGKMDLSEAEAVMDVISSKNDLALKNSVKQLNGSLYRKITEIREKILYETAFIESALDDPEHFDLTDYPDRLSEKLIVILRELEILSDSFNDGRLLSEGVKTVILGKPNVGKSSLLNILAGSDRAIVTEIAGTTRDTLEEYIKFGNIGLNLIDTAGIRETDNTVEQIGVDRAKKAAENADLIIYVIDISIGDSFDDITNGYNKLLSSYPDKKAIVLLNKVDIAESIKKPDTDYPVIEFSTVTGEGYEELKSTIEEMFFNGLSNSSDEVVVYVVNAFIKSISVDIVATRINVCIAHIGGDTAEVVLRAGCIVINNVYSCVNSKSFNIRSGETNGKSI